MRFYDLDIDVKNYAKRIIDAGYKCPADINSVSNFVKGLKTYNYYNSLIEGFFFRRSQNAGLDITAYGFKNSNGILRNGPIWDDNGIDLGDANNSRIIEAPVVLSSNPIPLTFIFIGSGSRDVLVNGENLFGVFQSFLYYSPEYISTQGLNGRFRGAFDSATVTDQVFHDSSGTASFSSSRATFFCVQAVYRSNTIGFSRNGANFSNSSALNNTGYQGTYRLILGGRINGNTLEQFYGGIISAVFVFQEEIDSATFYNLYKSTAGKGLGLP